MSLTKRTILMTTLTSLTALSLSLLSANVQADNAPVFSQLQNDLNAFAKQIQQLSNAQVQSQNNYRYQNDPQMSDIENNNVAVVQGSAFGLDGYFRISYATSMKNLKKAMERIKSFCENLI